MHFHEHGYVSEDPEFVLLLATASIAATNSPTKWTC